MKGKYRITVKREPASAPGLPAGLGSNYLHDYVEVGDVLMAQGPRGDFKLDCASPRPVVLLSGGVGLTPLVSMLHSLTQGSVRRVHAIHACENGDVHALRDEVLDLAKSRHGISAHFIYRAPTDQDRIAALFHSEGIVTKELLQQLLCLDDYDFYLCGPPPFMKAVYALLRDLGVSRARIKYEFFGPATVLEPDCKPAGDVVAPAALPLHLDGAAIVEFRRSGITAVWDASCDSLLSFAENQGLSPAFSCRSGICSTCKSTLISGSVTYFEEPLDEVPEGSVLLCCSKPHGPVVLDI
jgi:ferredoxin-NADP reductase/ferredoxin